MTKKLICCKCKNEIDRKKDRWVNVRDFDKGEKSGEVDMHLTCWKDMIRKKMQEALNERANQLTPMLKNLIGNLGGLTQNA